MHPQGEKYKENIGLMGERMRMLFDCQWTVEQLDSELLDLLRCVGLNKQGEGKRAASLGIRANQQDQLGENSASRELH